MTKKSSIRLTFRQTFDIFGTMNTQFAYKLVNASDLLSGYRSLLTSRQDSRTYRVGQWTHPALDATNQFLFVFRTRAQARAFRSERIDQLRLRIFRCKVVNMNDFRVGESRVGHPFRVTANSTWPKGTAFADAVMLLHRD